MNDGGRQDRLWPADGTFDVSRHDRRAPDGSDDRSINEEDPRVLEAMQAYLAAIESGEHVNRQEFVARYPDIAKQLSEYLDGVAFVHSAVGKIRGIGEPPPVAQPDPSMAEPLGDFRLVREIGRGGMGIVYEAMQISLGRRVALKVLSRAAALDARQIQRFRNEAQAAAQFHHTNIVPVHAVGCDRSVHYYAMQLIEGQSLAEVIRELRAEMGKSEPGEGEPSLRGRRVEAPSSWQSATEDSTPKAAGSLQLNSADLIQGVSSPANSLTTMRSRKRLAYHRNIARLGLQSADALDYAHKFGVVHRDIKPANLLLDVHGNVWITDFGLAQFYADAANNGLTQTGDLVGTFRYMSPEQASGRAVVLDQRTDVYSLGMTLYEVLTLEKALPGRLWEEIAREIQSVDPRPARSVDGTIPPELETIITKAVAKDPDDRYQTAKEMAEDLGRFLRDEPILARPPSHWERAVKWTRRHRSFTLTALGVLIVATAGLLTSNLLIAREQQRTKDAYDLEKAQRTRADQRYKEAREAVDFLTGIAAEDMKGPQFTELRVKILEASLTYYQIFLDEHKDDPAAEAGLNAARIRAWNILSELSALGDFGRVTARANLIAQDSVAEELKATPEQTNAARQLTDGLGERMRKEFGDFGQLTPDQRRDRFARLTVEVDAAVGAILDPDQVQRLRQIARQVKGAAAFSDSDVVEALSLTREQKDKIRTIQSSLQGFPPHDLGPRHNGPNGPGGDRHDGLPGLSAPSGVPASPGVSTPLDDAASFPLAAGNDDGRGPGTHPFDDSHGPDYFHDDHRPHDRQHDGHGNEWTAINEARGKAQREAVKQIIAELTPTQLATWRTLIGDPFTGKVFDGPPGAFGGGPPNDHGWHGPGR